MDKELKRSFKIDIGRKRKKNLRLHLLLLMCMAGIVPVVVLSVILLNTYEKRTISLRTGIVQNQCIILADHLYTYGYINNTVNESINAELAQLSNMYDGRVLIINGDFKVVKDTYSLNEGKYVLSEDVLRVYSKGESITTYDDKDHYIQVTTPIGDTKNENGIIGIMQVSVSTEEIAIQKNTMTHIIGLVLIALSAIIVGIAVYSAHIITKPFKELSDRLSNIIEGFDETQITVTDYAETEKISESFNHLLTRMKTLDDSRSEFVANVSHELKTPITSVKVLAESLTSQDDVPVEVYKEFMEDISHEIDREDAIINDLLALVKMDKEGKNLVVQSCDIELIIADIQKRLAPIADKAGIELIFETIRPVVAEVDETKLTLAITNIIENGIKYNTPGGFVKITLDAEPMYFTINIADSGIGIPQEDIPKVFERFYRVDKSHSREIGGTGLGLAITRNVIAMHQGAIKIESEVNVGTVVFVRVPLSHIITPAIQQK